MRGVDVVSRVFFCFLCGHLKTGKWEWWRVSQVQWGLIAHWQYIWLHAGSTRKTHPKHTNTLTWSGRFISRAENVIPLHWEIQLYKLNCVAFLDYSSICSMLDLSTSNQQYIFFESCMGFRFQGASVCLLVLIIHYKKRNPLGLLFRSLMQENPLCWLYTASYNLEWPPITARCSFILFCFLFFLEESGAFCLQTSKGLYTANKKGFLCNCCLNLAVGKV